MRQRPPIYPRTDTLFPYTTLCRSARYAGRGWWRAPLGRTTGPRGLNRMAGRDCDLTARSSIGTKRSMTRALDRFGRLDGLVNNYQALPWEENAARVGARSEEHTSELQSLMRISYAVFCLKQNKKKKSNSTIKY